MVLDGLVSLVFWLVWMVWFFLVISYIGWTYNLDITLEAEIRHAGSTHKNRIIQWVLDGLVGLDLIWFVWFDFSQPYNYFGWKFDLGIT